LLACHILEVAAARAQRRRQSIAEDAQVRVVELIAAPLHERLRARKELLVLLHGGVALRLATLLRLHEGRTASRPGFLTRLDHLRGRPLNQFRRNDRHTLLAGSEADADDDAGANDLARTD
jgi:hypothetical protein